jgi:hypothetical protein
MSSWIDKPRWPPSRSSLCLGVRSAKGNQPLGGKALAHLYEGLPDQRAGFRDPESFAKVRNKFVIKGDGRAHASILASFDAYSNAGRRSSLPAKGGSVLSAQPSVGFDWSWM